MPGPTENSLQHESRKRDHLRLALDPAHQAAGLSGLDGIRLRHEALPELDFSEVRLNAVRLNRPVASPFFVAALTAGLADADIINAQVASACRRRGWALGIGSQRHELENGAISPFWRRLHEREPGLELMANLGASQLIGTPISSVRRLVEESGASALVVHANPLQECVQMEGTPYFRGVLEALKRVCGELGKPVVLKETGCGFSRRTLERLAGIGLAAVDIAGLGGTHWGRIEGARTGNPAAQAFADWGVPTVDSLLQARQLLPSTEIWASGGVRSGVDAAKLLALGATQVGYAQPVLVALSQGPGALERWMDRQERELKIALFCTGCAGIAELRSDPLLVETLKA